MTLEIVRRIRGNIHGSIDISLLEDKVIAHPIFQRLRRIKQTAFLSFVFPGASHTRFEHSLGTMFLANKAWGKIKENLQRIRSNCQRIHDFSAKENQSEDEPLHGLLEPSFQLIETIFDSEYVLQTLRLAALLHDIGHPPFSHSGERFLPDLDSLLSAQKNLPDYLQLYFTQLNDLQKKHNHSKKVSHEDYSILLVQKLLSNVYEEDQHIQLKVEPQDVASIMTPHILPTDNSPLKKNNAYLLCRELISGEIDIDRMDYLQRDSKECGVVYGIFDAERILDSLTVYFDPKRKSFHLAIQFSGLAAFEDYLRARQSMYVQLYFHKTSVAGEAMLQNINTMIGGWSLPVDMDKYINVDEYNLKEVILESLRQKGKSLENYKKIESLLEDLFLNRRLWKRIYEASHPLDHRSINQDGVELEKLKNALMKGNILFEHISSFSYVTKLRPREKKELSQNYLRLIKKDSKQVPRVVPVEDFSNIIKGNSSTHIDRIYVPLAEERRAKEILKNLFF